MVTHIWNSMALPYVSFISYDMGYMDHLLGNSLAKPVFHLIYEADSLTTVYHTVRPKSSGSLFSILISYSSLNSNLNLSMALIVPHTST